MSTIVHTPVRVKPPPAESGEIISPGCALRSTTTPPNGARIACLSSTAALRCASSRAVSRCECDCRSCAVSTPTRASDRVRSASLAKFFCDRLRVRVRMRVASSRSAVIMAVAASAASARERASARSFSASTLSSRATICPACTTMPSSIRTSTTLPVISAATVALRRATT